jgi:murein L,D-transpeptidase YafK
MAKQSYSVEDRLQMIIEPVTSRLDVLLKDKGLDLEKIKLILLAIKEEKVLHAYHNPLDGKPIFLKTYPLTASSGSLGPKLKEGDKQIPEGFYQIEYLNPNSAYYLSMKVNYPNEEDLEISDQLGISEPGSFIMIHGKDQSTGCLAIGDEGIEELFYLAGINPKHKVKVIISPVDFRKKDYQDLKDRKWVEERYKRLAATMRADY